LLSIATLYYLFDFTKPSEAGAFGDSFGMINSLFSGLAFAGIIISIILQSKELKLQRLEIAENREVMISQQQELAHSANAQVASQKELAKQSLNMKRTAELNALSTLLNDIHTEENYYRGLKQSHHDALEELNKYKLHYRERIKLILDHKSE
jgi:hypothetical protein